jgi:hypothetical protein
MGGHVAVTVRLSPDETYRMVWGTHGLGLIQDPAFLNQSGAFWAARLQQWRTNQDLKGTLAPCGYGLAVVDFLTRRILSLQGYTWVGRYDLIHLDNRPDGEEELLAQIQHGRVHQVRAARAMQASRHEAPRWEERDFPLSAYGATSDEQVSNLASLGRAWRATEHRAAFSRGRDTEVETWCPKEALLDLSPFSLMENFGEARAEWTAAYAAIQEMELPLTVDEEAAWQAWLSHYSP